MRVVAGSVGGRRLAVPAGRKMRPTTERVREAVFSALESLGAVAGARVLDLFAGSGSMGIEALSRGAATATFVEADPAAVRTIRDNLTATRLSGGMVVKSDVLRFVEQFLPQPAEPPFDLVLADPPYAFDQWPRLLVALPASLAVLETGREIELPEGWEPLRPRRYGDTVVTIARRT